MRAVVAFIAGVLVTIGAGVGIVAGTTAPLTTGTLTGRIAIPNGVAGREMVYVRQWPLRFKYVARKTCQPTGGCYYSSRYASKVWSLSVGADGAFSASLPVGSYTVLATGTGPYLCGGGPVEVTAGVETALTFHCQYLAQVASSGGRSTGRSGWFAYTPTSEGARKNAAAVHPCTSQSVFVDTNGHDGVRLMPGMLGFDIEVVFADRGSSPCTLSGWPRLFALQGRAEMKIPGVEKYAVDTTGKPPRPPIVTLTPATRSTRGHNAYLYIGFSTFNGDVPIPCSVSHPIGVGLQTGGRAVNIDMPGVWFCHGDGVVEFPWLSYDADGQVNPPGVPTSPPSG